MSRIAMLRARRTQPGYSSRIAADGRLRVRLPA